MNAPAASSYSRRETTAFNCIMDHAVATTQRLELIAHLRAEIHAVLAPLKPRGSFALVDFPDYANVGDSAIWLGQTKLMAETYGSLPAYVASNRSFDAAACEAAIGDGPIFICGGGNFGDLWPHHQQFRLRLLAAFKGRPIIQLPQSIHFNDPAAMAKTADAITRHGNFTLLVRDHASKVIARLFDCPVELCCDMAFGLGPLRQPAAPAQDVVCLLRTDKERVVPQDATDAHCGGRPVDWTRESKMAVRAAGMLAMVKAVAAAKRNADHLRFARYEAAARTRLHRGMRLLCSGRVAITDRLHGHILCLLLGMPHAVLDNSYRKLSAFIECWTGDSPCVFQAASLQQAASWTAAEARQSTPSQQYQSARGDSASRDAA